MNIMPKRWNTKTERLEMDQLLDLYTFTMLVEEDAPNDDFQMNSFDFNGMNMLMNNSTGLVVDNDIEMTGLPTESATDLMLNYIMDLADRMFTPLVNTNINFDRPPIQIAEMNESECKANSFKNWRQPVL
jgi:hypothetical protein